MSETAKPSGPDLEPTPTPWDVERHTSGVIFITALHARTGDIADLYHIDVRRGEASVIVQKDNAEANAAFIVTAVNAHEALKTALRDLYEEANKLDPSTLSNGFHLALSNARDAIALAETKRDERSF